MKKNIIALIGILALVAFFATACGQQKTAAPKGEQAATSGQEKTYTLNLNCTYPPPKYEWESKYIANDKFAKRVEEATNGRVKVKVFYNNQLAPQAQGLEAVKNAVVDIESCASYWGGVIPESDFLWLPFWSKGEEHAIHAVRETEIGKILDEAYRKQGAHILFYWPVSIEGIISKKPVKSYADIKGMRMRMGSSIWPSWYQKMGVAPINVAAAEQYEALMRGTMDGTIYPIYTIDTYKFHEVCKNLTLPGFVDPMLCYSLVSLKTWDALPADLKQIIEKVALEIEKESIAGSQKLTNSVLDLCAQHKVAVHKLTKAEFEKFKESAMPLWEEFAAKNPQCAKMVQIIKEDLKKWEATNPESKEWEERWLAK